MTHAVSKSYFPIRIRDAETGVEEVVKTESALPNRSFTVVATAVKCDTQKDKN